MTLTEVGTVVPPTGSTLFTGADIHPAGTGLLLRTYTHVWYYALPSADVGAVLTGAFACAVPNNLEMQGETVAFTANGEGYVTVSEGAGASVNHTTCGE